MEKDYSFLLKELLTNCLTSRKLLEKAYKYGEYSSTPFKYSYDTYSSFIKITDYLGDKKAIKQNKLINKVEESKKEKFEHLQIEFDSSPKLTLYISSIEEITIKPLQFKVRPWFSQNYTAHISEQITTRTLIYKISHGAISTTISKEEAIAFFKLYHTNLSKINEELDLVKIKERIKNHQD